ncbi:MAG: hypothetical protein NXI04_08685 [Planctomycetaceae bacterium]|nr:hypothetical protein [Planctomycetaceae bacterium]
MTTAKCDKSMAVSQYFPLPLTDFEHYAFNDDSPEHPMVIIMRTLLEGPVDAGVLENAIRSVIKDNPLLHSTIDGSRWSPRWKLAKHLEPSFTVVDTGTADPSEQCAARRIDLTQQTGVQCELRRGANRSVLVTWFHHACVDGIGAIRFLGDVFAEYGQHTSAPDQERPSLRTIDHSLLARRGTRRMPGNGRDRRAPLVHTLMETFRLFGRRAYRLLRQPPSLQPAANTASPNIIQTRILDRQVTRRLKRLAAEQGVTTNDLCMLVFLDQLERWAPGNAHRRPADLFRVLMPVSMRNPEHDQISASNVLSYVFHSYRRQEIRDTNQLLANIHRKSHQMLTRNEGAAMLWGFAIARRIPGLFRFSRRVQPDFATTVLTNVGEVRRLFENRFPLKKGRAVAGNVLIQSVDGVAPVRENTNIAMAFGTYGGELIMHVSRNTRLFSEADVDVLLDALVDRITGLTEIPATLVKDLAMPGPSAVGPSATELSSASDSSSRVPV